MIHDSQTTINYTYDGWQVIAEYEGGNLVRKFIYGPGIDEQIYMIDVANGNKIYCYHFDGLGSVVALSDVNNTIVERYSYDVFGEPNRTSDVNNPYFFTGRRYDSEFGLYYYRARYYKPYIGRFIHTDPIRYAAGLNLYTYCGNNPINWTDPYGMYPWIAAWSMLDDFYKSEPVANTLYNESASLRPVSGKSCYNDLSRARMGMADVIYTGLEEGKTLGGSWTAEPRLRESERRNLEAGNPDCQRAMRSCIAAAALARSLRRHGGSFTNARHFNDRDISIPLDRPHEDFGNVVQTFGPFRIRKTPRQRNIFLYKGK